MWVQPFQGRMVTCIGSQGSPRADNPGLKELNPFGIPLSCRSYRKTIVMPPRPYLLMEANHRQLTESPPKVAVLPWGATEAHNRHLPYGTDIIESTRVA